MALRRTITHALVAAAALCLLALPAATPADAAPSKARAKRGFLIVKGHVRANGTVVAVIRVRRRARVRVSLRARCGSGKQRWKRTIRPRRGRRVVLRARCATARSDRRAPLTLEATGRTTADDRRTVTVSVPLSAPAPGGDRTPPGGEAPDAGAADARLSWEPPALTDPITVRPSAVKRSLRLDPARDYIVDMPDEPLAVAGGLMISGGRNVVMIGGEITIPWQGDAPPQNYGRGLYLHNQSGTVHVEGLRLSGADLTEGIDLAQPHGTTVQLQNIRVERLTARDEGVFASTHPDILQTWAGPGELRVDRLTGTTNYQGFFLHPQQIGGQPPPRIFDIRRVDITGTDTSRYLLWQATPFPLKTEDVWVAPRTGRSLQYTLWPDPGAWPGVSAGSPPAGSFVPEGVAGPGYRSPGYR